MEDGNRVYINVGDVIRLRLPYSEICIRWGVAGKPLNVELLEEGAAELLKHDGTSFPLPVLHSEVGIYLDNSGRYYVPTQAVVQSQALRLFIPKPESTLAASGRIVPGSAIVGEDTGEPTISVDYEGNVYGAANLGRYWERAFQAASRQLARYPTVARSRVQREDLIPVGWWDVERHEVTFDGSEEVAWLVGQWLGLVANDPAELRATPSTATIQEPGGDQLAGM